MGGQRLFEAVVKPGGEQRPSPSRQPPRGRVLVLMLGFTLMGVYRDPAPTLSLVERGFRPRFTIVHRFTPGAENR